VIHSFVRHSRGVQIGDDFLLRMRTWGAGILPHWNRVVLQDGSCRRRWIRLAKQPTAATENPDKRVRRARGRVEVQAISASTAATMARRASDAAPSWRPGPCRHGSRVGTNTWLCGQVGWRSTKIGRIVFLRASRSGRAITVGDRNVVTAQSGIPNDLAGDKGIRRHAAWTAAMAEKSSCTESHSRNFKACSRTGSRN